MLEFIKFVLPVLGSAIVVTAFLIGIIALFKNYKK